jgi:fermentation-respiration switch protein FrsA (DUF1100 family)
MAALMVAGYALLTLAACVSVDGMLYYPQYGGRERPDDLRRVRQPDGGELAVLYLPNPDARFTLWYFHGNAEDLGDIQPRLRELHAAGFSVFAFDYPGYGWSDGTPSEKSIAAATHAARAYLRDELKISPAQTLLYGRSLGGGPAVTEAVEGGAAGLILENSFTSVYRVMTRWRLLPFDQFENLRKMPHVRCPVLVLHASDDRVIPVHHGRALFAAAAEPKRALWVDFAGHNDLRETARERYWQALRDFAGLCAADAQP